ncbi:hypothetical protein AVEN_166491-1 [Araneus ventricosus]|uniref:Uncharacterized protein n=1 Tax=Araneus ventricosus TaxID=182803 RepID=A0A4Y2S7B5_ARAVE|nr:hypothetical protein AVEN_166491-1 [Araneus ventricosus]
MKIEITRPRPRNSLNLHDRYWTIFVTQFPHTDLANFSTSSSRILLRNSEKSTMLTSNTSSLYVASPKAAAVGSLLEPSVRLQGREPNLRIPAPADAPPLYTVTDKQIQLTQKENIPVRGCQVLSTPKSFRRLNGEHIVLCKKKDLQLD